MHQIRGSATSHVCMYSQVPNKQGPLLIILEKNFQPYSHFFHPTQLPNFPPYLFIMHLFSQNSTLLDQRIFNPTHLSIRLSFLIPPYSISKFSSLLVYLALLVLIFHPTQLAKFLPYSFIRPYFFSFSTSQFSTYLFIRPYSFTYYVSFSTLLDQQIFQPTHLLSPTFSHFPQANFPPTCLLGPTLL